MEDKLKSIQLKLTNDEYTQIMQSLKNSRNYQCKILCKFPSYTWGEECKSNCIFYQSSISAENKIKEAYNKK